MSPNTPTRAQALSLLPVEQAEVTRQALAGRHARVFNLAAGDLADGGVRHARLAGNGRPGFFPLQQP